jgi:hypothetical protein
MTAQRRNGNLRFTKERVAMLDYGQPAGSKDTTALNLFAALFAAASAGFLATPDKVCAWHHLPLLRP